MSLYPQEKYMYENKIYVEVVVQRLGNKWCCELGYLCGKNKIVSLLPTIYINQCKSQKYKCFSNFSVHQNHLEDLLKHRFFKSLLYRNCDYVWDGTQEFAYLTRYHGMLMLLIWVCHFKNHCYKMFRNKSSRLSLQPQA